MSVKQWEGKNFMARGARQRGENSLGRPVSIVPVRAQVPRRDEVMGVIA